MKQGAQKPLVLFFWMDSLPLAGQAAISQCDQLENLTRLVLALVTFWVALPGCLYSTTR